MKPIDLRSDTVTLPTPAMREAMYRAEVGDDVFGEDPTVNRLEAMAAERMGVEAGLYVTSGTMGNLAALLAHCQRGDEVILGDVSHTYLYEAGGSAALGGIHPRPIPNQPNGMLDPADVAAAVRPDDEHFPRSRLVCLENTHNRCGGAVLSPGQIKAVADVAREHNMKVHMDGARIFNAAVALGLPASELTRDVDSVTFCLSKGLSAPVGSVLCGSQEFVSEARRARKILGGGMRQAGIIAAAGIVALEQMVDRMADDHANARRLAEGLAEIPGIVINPETVQTNIVYFDLGTEAITVQDLLAGLEREGVRILDTGPSRFRAVTHYGIEREDIETALAAFQRVMNRP